MTTGKQNMLFKGVPAKTFGVVLSKVFFTAQQKITLFVFL